MCVCTNSLPLMSCPPLFPHPHLTAMVCHLQKFNFHYFMFIFTLFYLPPSLSANIFTSPKGGT